MSLFGLGHKLHHNPEVSQGEEPIGWLWVSIKKLLGDSCL